MKLGSLRNGYPDGYHATCIYSHVCHIQWVIPDQWGSTGNMSRRYLSSRNGNPHPDPEWQEMGPLVCVLAASGKKARRVEREAAVGRGGEKGGGGVAFPTLHRLDALRISTSPDFSSLYTYHLHLLLHLPLPLPLTYTLFYPSLSSYSTCPSKSRRSVVVSTPPCRERSQTRRRGFHFEHLLPQRISIHLD